MNTASPNVTIKDVARRSGVSPMTVSRVINASERVSPETRRRVEHAIAELGYEPSRLDRFGVPCVLVDRTVPGTGYDAVLGDSLAGAQQLVEHLISLGHRRIGFIVESDDVSTARDRRRGYEAALEAAGIPLDPALVAEADVDPGGGSEGMRRLLELEDRPTAVFTVHKLVALGAIEAVRAAR